jgi:hypothetical protein
MSAGSYSFRDNTSMIAREPMEKHTYKREVSGDGASKTLHFPLKTRRNVVARLVDPLKVFDVREEVEVCPIQMLR